MSLRLSGEACPIVLIVEDHRDARCELKHVLRQKGCRVIDTDNGRDATQRLLKITPDLLLIAMDVPLLYGLVAARQIIKNAGVGPLPVLVVTHENAGDLEQLSEVGISNNEYVTPLSGYREFQDLLDYLLPILPATEHGYSGREPQPESAGVRPMPAVEVPFRPAHPPLD